MFREPLFQALRYEKDSDAYIVQGPIANPRRVQDEQEYTLRADIVPIRLGTPVICHGLKGTLAHLNGKIGDLRSYEEEKDSYEVHFEDKDPQPCFVKHAHVRIVFELPDIE